MKMLPVRASTKTSSARWFLALFAALALLVAACGGEAPQSAEGGGGEGEGGEGEAAEVDSALTGPRSVIRFAFAPDPVMDYLLDTGTLAEMEEEWNVRLEMTSAWDEFAFFAGGHGDIVSMATYDLPLMEEETGIKTVTFGKYNTNRNGMFVRGDSPYQNMEDLVGQKVLTGGVTGTTLLWGTLSKHLHGTDFLFDGGDYEVALNDHAVNPELLVRGEAEGCICLPELATKYLRTGELRLLYDGMSPSELWTAEVDPTHEDGIMTNVFTTTQEYYDSHPHEIAFFLALWERGLEMWHNEKEDIINLYPQHFAVEDQEDIDFLAQEYMVEHDWFVDSVYLDQTWIDGELGLFDIMKETGFMEPDAITPTFTIEEPQPTPDGAVETSS